MPAAWVGAAAGVIGLMNQDSGGSYGGGYSGGNFLYQPYGEPMADAGWQAQAGQQAGMLNNYYGAVPGYAQTAFNNQFFNPYGTSMVGAAQNAGQTAGSIGNYDIGAAQNMFGAGNQILGTGFDPQQALYDRLFQQQRDQTNANLYTHGVAEGGYGAGIANQADTNFNIDWQNAQLQRQLSAGQGASNLYGAANAAGGAGVNNFLQAGALPYTAQNTLGQGQNAALQNYTGQFSPIFQQQGNLMNQYLAYMGLSGGAQQAQLGAAQNQRDFNAQQMQLLGQGLGYGAQRYFGGSNNGVNSYNANNYYSSDGTFTPAYTGYDSSGGAAYG